MRFYLNNEEVRIEITPTLTETLDLTLDTLGIVLEANSRAEPYEPHTPFRIDFENGEVADFVIAADKVSVFSYEPLRYKHDLSLQQNTRTLVHHLVRNSVFSQPTNDKKAFYGQYIILGEADYSDPVQAELKIENNVGLLDNAMTYAQVTQREKVNKAFVKIDVWVAVSQIGETKKAQLYKPKNLAELRAIVGKDDIYLNNIRAIRPDDEYGAFDYYLGDIDGNDFENEQESTDLKERINIYGNKIIGVAPQLETSLDSVRYRNPEQFVIGTFTPETEKSITFILVNVRTRLETYYYNCYEIIELLLERQQQKYADTYKEPLFSLPESGELYDLLTTTVAPNITLTQATMFDALTEIFNLFDATFTIKEGILGIEYLNERSKGEIAKKNFAGINLQITEEKRVNGLITYYQNAKHKVKFPNNGYSRVRSAQLGVPNENDYNFLVNYPIDIIERVESPITKFRVPHRYPEASSGDCAVTGTLGIDLTPFVVEESVWSLLPTTDQFPLNGEYRNVIQKNSIYYTRGDNKIQVSATYEDRFGQIYYCYRNARLSGFARMLGASNPFLDGPNNFEIISPTFDNWANIYFNATYISTIDGRLRIESIDDKYKGEMVINQSNGGVDLSRLGLNMLGVSMKTGEPSLHANHTITSWNNRVIKGQTLTYNGEEWVANVCQYTILDETHFKGDITFVKNFNALSTRIKLNREKRLTNISTNLTAKSEDNIIEYCYFTLGNSASADIIALEDMKVFDSSVLGQCLMKTFYTSAESLDISLAVINSSLLEYPVAIPLVRYGSGNMICFEMSYTNPISAGNQLTVKSGWFGTDKYFSQNVIYTDEEGFLDNVDIYFTAYDDFSADYPQYKDINLSYYGGKIENYVIKKQPNEIMALNYQICFLPVDKNKDFIGKQFISNNALVSIETFKSEFVIYYTLNDSEFQYNIFDIKGQGNSTPIIFVDMSISGKSVDIEFLTDTIAGGVKTWAICDKEGNIYFATNNRTVGDTNAFAIKFYFKHERL